MSILAAKQQAEPYGAPFLGVERSFGARTWRLRHYDEKMALSIAQSCGVPDLIGRLLAARGQSSETAASFLNPKLREALPDPMGLKGMTNAIDRLSQAIAGNESIAIFGDYDVDGATSAALLMRFLRSAGAREPQLYVPDRVTEGYGPNTEAFRRLCAAGATVIVTVDCGITAFEPLEEAQRMGLDVIVVDHHVAEPRLPNAAAIVNPNRLDDDFPFKQLAAVGVTFLLTVGLNRELRRRGWYCATRPEPDLMAWLDLVALGTICDVVPLTGPNRALVAQGLRVLAARSNTGLRLLGDVAGIGERIDAYHAGYVLGPRVNAGGRVGRADLGAKLLSTDEPVAAREMAMALDAYNQERRSIEARVLDEAMRLAEDQMAGSPPLLFVVGREWHQGVIGIVAGRLKDRFQRPVCVVSLNGGLAKASCRSISGVDIGSAIIAAREAGLLEKGGGHAMAAGFELPADGLDALRDFLMKYLLPATSILPAVPVLALDGVLQSGAATLAFMQWLQSLAPFGSGNAEPRFALPSMRVVRADIVGDGHVRCVLLGGDGMRLKAIAFRAVDGALGSALLTGGGMPLHLAGRLKVNQWQGREEVQFQIEDGAPGAG